MLHITRHNVDEALQRSLGIAPDHAKHEIDMLPDRALPYLVSLAQHLRYHPIEDR